MISSKNVYFEKRKSMLRSPYYHLTFCITLTGTSTFLNISVPLQASSSAISCGVVTITAPAQMCISIQNYYLGPILAEAINRFCWKDSPLGWLIGTNKFSLNPIECRVIPCDRPGPSCLKQLGPASQLGGSNTKDLLMLP